MCGANSNRTTVSQEGGAFELPIDLAERRYLPQISVQAEDGNAVYGIQLDVEAVHSPPSQRTRERPPR